MKAVVYEAFSAPPKIMSVADPRPEPHGVVVAVMATGVCRSDWHGWVGLSAHSSGRACGDLLQFHKLPEEARPPWHAGPSLRRHV